MPKEEKTTDQLIWEGCVRQDRESQKRLYENYKRPLFTLVYRMLNNREEAHDVLQEAFIDIFQNIGKLQDARKIGSWAKTIVVRKAIYRLKQIKKMRFQDIENYRGAAPKSDDELKAWYLEKAIRELPDGFRMVFTLVEIEGYKHKEVAEIMEISEGTSRSQLFHAKKVLKEKLKDLR